jgi:hypothetical protein
MSCAHTADTVEGDSWYVQVQMFLTAVSYMGIREPVPNKWQR